MNERDKQSGLFEVRPVALARTDPIAPDRPPRPCGWEDCAISTGIHEGLTFGRGTLDKHGYWSIPCGPCARAYEQQNPGVVAWPFAPAHPALAPDVLRVIAPSSGKPSTALVGEGSNMAIKEFWLVQLKDGRYMRRFLDGTQGPALPSVTDDYVTSLIAGGGWREITREVDSDRPHNL